ncbi:LytR/AlgR family response regulator transcription factor [Crassaminicella indica]|uniref:LytTR family DNA-binding domain-containing protein n=1 Tax=Crassaminicella indica TaxID=2855394 RepID=A0ABX8RER6_9CLOT|nr:LytTR family DNA-binding domain-containing protein [Crassaminicella indica]QXM06235.1 LytTR family DNA-binding domain-containing protein [Crassaminicella indica]
MNILICDDDLYTRKMLEKIVSQNPFVDTVFLAKDGVEAINMIKNESIDIALMDIDMPNLDGIDAAKMMSNLSSKTRFIFITAYMEHAIESFSVHPYDYLLKPIDISKFKYTLNNLIIIVMEDFKENGIRKITIKDKSKISVVPLKEILYFEKVDRDVLVHTQKEEYTLSKTLTELEDKLNSSFCRVHQSFIVNIEKIKTITNMGNRSYQIEFTGSEKTALMSRYKFEKLKKIVIF